MLSEVSRVIFFIFFLLGGQNYYICKIYGAIL